MSARALGLALLAALACAAPAQARPATAAGDGRPNVLLVMTDDQALEDLRHMPNVQRLLVDRGTSFSQAITSFPLCCPSRATVLTGQFAHNHGVSGNFAPEGWYGMKKRANTLGTWLQRAGYRTSLVGKWLNGYGARGQTEVPAGWTDWHGILDLSAYDYFNFTMNDNGRLRTYGDADYARRLNAFAVPVERREIANIGDFARLLSTSFVPGDFGTARPEDYTVDVTASVTDRILRHESRSRRPFFAWWSVAAPHREDVNSQRGIPWRNDPRPAPRDEAAAQRFGLPRPPSFDEADVSDKPSLLRDLPPLDDRAVERLQHNYEGRIGSLQAVDRGVARLMGTLKATRQLDNTVVVFTSDNGWVQGEHRIPGDKFVPYEESIKVPLIVRGPGFAAGRVVDNPVSNADLAPTLLDLGRARPGRRMDGTSLVPFARRPRTAPYRAMPVEATGKLFAAEGFPQEYDRPYSGLRTRRFKYVRWDYGPRELYDLRADPYEMTNLAGDPAHAGTVARLEAQRRKLARCRGRACLATKG